MGSKEDRPVLALKDAWPSWGSGTGGRWGGAVAPDPAEKDRLLDLAMKGRLDKEGETRLLGLLRQEQGQREGPSEGPLMLTDEEERQLRRAGHDPRLIARMNEVKNVSDYVRLKAEVEKGGAA